ncbi:hypothetical protein B0H13DRAFT_1888329 [Mycena leptocephala]|nr:hypothetical protein B0H13DRAFT_1888329 [Mycena leptocephala]
MSDALVQIKSKPAISVRRGRGGDRFRCGHTRGGYGEKRRRSGDIDRWDSKKRRTRAGDEKSGSDTTSEGGGAKGRGEGEGSQGAGYARQRTALVRELLRGARAAPGWYTLSLSISKTAIEGGEWTAAVSSHVVREMRIGFTTEQHKAEDRLQDIPDFDEPFGSEDPLDDVLHGSARTDISHTGQNLDIQQAEEEGDALWEALRESHRCLFFLQYSPPIWLSLYFSELYTRRPDYRTISLIPECGATFWD